MLSEKTESVLCDVFGNRGQISDCQVLDMGRSQAREVRMIMKEKDE